MQKRRCFFAARGGIWRFGLFSRWLSERQIMNEHPCARAPPQPLHFLPAPCRPRRTFPRPPPPPAPPDSTPDVNRWALADATDTTWHVDRPRDPRHYELCLPYRIDSASFRENKLECLMSLRGFKNSVNVFLPYFNFIQRKQLNDFNRFFNPSIIDLIF